MCERIEDLILIRLLYISMTNISLILHQCFSFQKYVISIFRYYLRFIESSIFKLDLICVNSSPFIARTFADPEGVMGVATPL